MNFPDNLKYTKDHEWIKVEGNQAIVGITAFAQGELGDIVYVEVDTIGEIIEQNEVFGTIEAVKTVSDLFLPVSGTILELNTSLEDSPEKVNEDPYEAGWIVKMELTNIEQLEGLMNAEEYKALVGH